MSHAIVNPDGLHDPVPFGYSHTAAIAAGTDLVLVSGQYGSGPDGAVVSTEFAEQVQQAFGRAVATPLPRRRSSASPASRCPTSCSRSKPSLHGSEPKL